MKTLSIAGVTVREALSHKFQVNLLFFGALLIGASFLAGAVTVGESHRIVADLGLSGMELVSVLLAVFLGAGVVAGEVERRTIYAVIAKPVTRSAYLLGRYVGLAVALLANLLLMSVILALVLAVDARSFAPVSATLAGAVGLVYVKVLTIAAVAVVFSTFTNATLAAILGLAVTVAGYLAGEVRALWQGGGRWIPKALWYALPDLGALSGNDAVIYRTALPGGTALACLHALLYAGAALALAAAVLERRDFR